MSDDARCNASLLSRLALHAEKRPAACAYRLPKSGESLCYRNLAGAITSLGQRLGETNSPGDVVLLSCANQLRYPVAFLGILAAGCSVFPVSPEAADAELLRAADESRAMGVIGNERAIRILGPKTRSSLLIDRVPLKNCLETGTPVPQRNSAAPGGIMPGSLLLQSSGTTGLPKIVRRAGDSLNAAAVAIVDALGFGAEDRVLMTVPLTHSYGLEHGLLAPIWAGSCVHLFDGLELPLVLAELAAGKVTILPGVPSTFEMLSRVMDDRSPTSQLRLAYSAGAPLPPAVRDAFATRFGVSVTQLYGASEIGSVTYNPPQPSFDPASVGFAMRGVSVRILDLDGSDRPLPAEREGQVAVKARSMFTGYVNAEADCIDGHFPTGDIGYLDDTGRLYITGRIKLLIDVGGFKVNPLEVESVLQRHPSVGACVVVAVRQSQTVFRLKAVITPNTASVSVPVAELRQLARANLAAYKVPRLFEVRDSLPRSATGKVLRNLLETT